MKTIVLIAVFALFALWGCDDGVDLYDNEIVVSRDCTNGSETGVEFDSDSVRCGRNGSAYFGLGPIYDTMSFSPLGFYLFHDSSILNSLDSVWILETDSVKISSCEKLEIPHADILGEFCLKKFENNNGRETVPGYVDLEKKIDYGSFFVYSKYGSYKALCNVGAYDCDLHYSCVIQYNGTYNFSKIPDADDVEEKQRGCLE